MAELRGDSTPTIAFETGLKAYVERPALDGIRKVSLGDAAVRKVGTTDSDVASGVRGTPAGGTTGQVLGKTGTTDFQVGWVSGGISIEGPLFDGDLVHWVAANARWERLSPGAFTVLPDSWQRYDLSGNPFTVSDADAIAELEGAKSVLAVPVPAPVAPAVFSSVGIARLPHHRATRITFAGANVVLDQAITGIPDGDSVFLFVRQDATGGRTISENHANIFTWGTDPFGINPAANAESVLVMTGRPGGNVRIHNTGFST